MKNFATILAALLLATDVSSSARADDPNPGVNQPDQVAWQLFVKVNAPAAGAGNNNAVFETWASNDDTFSTTPKFPGATPSPLQLKTPALSLLAPPGTHPLVQAGGGEEVRRNLAAFEFITKHNLHLQSGLKKAFLDGKPITFPPDAIEIKANWVRADASGIDASRYHINTAPAPDGKKYALVSMHIISKLVPNWTWATFEHSDNLGRCDIIGCRDSFGATVPSVPAAASSGQKYAVCEKTPALQKMFADAKLEASWKYYCLKGSQVDFTDSTGVPTRLGNSVTERGFVNTSSCITCHSRAAVDATGAVTSAGGFLFPPTPALCPTGSLCSPNGTPNPTWFWTDPGKPTQKMIALQTDFVWSIRLAVSSD